MKNENVRALELEVMPEVVKSELVVQAPNPMRMLELAVERGMDVTTISGLMDLNERWEKAEALKAYNVAFSAFKAEAVQIIKNKSVTDGPLKGKSYAELFSVVDAVTPALSKHELAASWKVTKDEKDWIEVTCYLRHAKGHSEAASFGGPPDAGGAKNAIQARASTLSYLQRYTLKAVCGVAEGGEDSDGGSKEGRMSQEEIDKWVKEIEATTTKEAATSACALAVKVANNANDLAAYNTLKGCLRTHKEFIDQAGGTK